MTEMVFILMLVASMILAGIMDAVKQGSSVIIGGLIGCGVAVLAVSALGIVDALVRRFAHRRLETNLALMIVCSLTIAGIIQAMSRSSSILTYSAFGCTLGVLGVVLLGVFGLITWPLPSGGPDDALK